MLSAKIKDIKFRKSYFESEKKKLVNKVLFINLLNKKKYIKQNYNNKLTFSVLDNAVNKKYNSKVRVTRRCVFNNRNRGVVRSFGISRVYLRELMQFGLIPGYSKAVW